MCTVTFIPKHGNEFILTSNRDEAPGRETLFPEIYVEEDVKLLYPKDALAGGTWIGISERKRALTLMNGGFVAHKHKPPYRKSRGVVAKDFLKTQNLRGEVDSYDFKDIEPFTVIIVEWIEKIQLFQMVWDGVDLHFSEEPLAPKIWSSSPLYSKNLQRKRENWFSGFLLKKVDPTYKELLEFHETAGDGDLMSNLVMDREMVKTKSITQIVKNNASIEMFYKDLQEGREKQSEFNIG